MKEDNPFVSQVEDDAAVAQPEWGSFMASWFAKRSRNQELRREEEESQATKATEQTVKSSKSSILSRLISNARESADDDDAVVAEAEALSSTPIITPAEESTNKLGEELENQALFENALAAASGQEIERSEIDEPQPEPQADDVEPVLNIVTDESQTTIEEVPGAPTHGYRGELVVRHEQEEIAEQAKVVAASSSNSQQIAQESTNQTAAITDQLKDFETNLNGITNVNTVPITHPDLVTHTAAPISAEASNDTRTYMDDTSETARVFPDQRPGPLPAELISKQQEAEQHAAYIEGLSGSSIKAVDKGANQEPQLVDQFGVPLERAYERRHEVKGDDRYAVVGHVPAEIDEDMTYGSTLPVAVTEPTPGTATPVGSILSSSPLFAAASAQTSTTPHRIPPAPLYTPPAASLAIPQDQSALMGAQGSSDMYRQAISRGVLGGVAAALVLALIYLIK